MGYYVCTGEEGPSMVMKEMIGRTSKQRESMQRDGSGRGRGMGGEGEEKETREEGWSKGDQ